MLKKSRRISKTLGTLSLAAMLGLSFVGCMKSSRNAQNPSDDVSGSNATTQADSMSLLANDMHAYYSNAANDSSLSEGERQAAQSWAAMNADETEHVLNSDGMKALDLENNQAQAVQTNGQAIAGYTLIGSGAALLILGSAYYGKEKMLSRKFAQGEPALWEAERFLKPTKAALMHYESYKSLVMETIAKNLPASVTVAALPAAPAQNVTAAQAPKGWISWGRDRVASAWRRIRSLSGPTAPAVQPGAVAQQAPGLVEDGKFVALNSLPKAAQDVAGKFYALYDINEKGGTAESKVRAPFDAAVLKAEATWKGEYELSKFFPQSTAAERLTLGRYLDSNGKVKTEATVIREAAADYSTREVIKPGQLISEIMPEVAQQPLYKKLIADYRVKGADGKYRMADMNEFAKIEAKKISAEFKNVANKYPIMKEGQVLDLKARVKIPEPMTKQAQTEALAKYRNGEIKGMAAAGTGFAMIAVGAILAATSEMNNQATSLADSDNETPNFLDETTAFGLRWNALVSR